MSRTFRKAYTKSKRFDKSCRNHGGCPYCEGNRLHKHRKQPTVEQELKQIGIQQNWLMHLPDTEEIISSSFIIPTKYRKLWLSLNQV